MQVSVFVSHSNTHTQFVLGQSVQGGEAAMRSSLCEAANPNNKISPHHRELRSLRTLYERCTGSLTSSANYVTFKMKGTGPTVFPPYPRGLECLTISKLITITKAAHSPQ